MSDNLAKYRADTLNALEEYRYPEQEQLINLLNIDEGTASFVHDGSLDNYAYMVWRHSIPEISISEARQNIFALIEKFQKDLVADENNKVIIEEVYGYPQKMSIIDARKIQAQFRALSPEKIERYVTPAFDAIVESLIAPVKAPNYPWVARYSRPDTGDYQIQTEDNKVSLFNRLKHRINNTTQVELIHDAVVSQLPYGCGCEPSDISYMESMLEAVAAGKLDNYPALPANFTIQYPYPNVYYPQNRDRGAVPNQSSSTNQDVGTMVKILAGVTGGTLLVGLCFVAWRAESFGQWFKTIKNAGSSAKDSMMSGFRRFNVFAQPAVEQASKEELQELRVREIPSPLRL